MRSRAVSSGTAGLASGTCLGLVRAATITMPDGSKPAAGALAIGRGAPFDCLIPPGVQAVSYDALNQIHYRGSKTVLTGSSDDGGVRFFPITRFQPTPVGIYLVENGVAAPFHFNPDEFDMPADSPLVGVPYATQGVPLAYRSVGKNRSPF